MTVLSCSLLQEVAPCWCGGLPQRAGICGVVYFSAVSQQTHWICHRHPSQKVSTLSCIPLLVNSSATTWIDHPSQLSVEFSMDEDNNLTMNDFAYCSILQYAVTSCRQLNRIQIIFLSLAHCTLQKQCNSNCFFFFYQTGGYQKCSKPVVLVASANWSLATVVLLDCSLSTTVWPHSWPTSSKAWHWSLFRTTHTSSPRTL